ncbi:MAG: hypothetical protein JWM97_407, partial [Phycisphaerales bacterium]|nr:hypothetical protein [Phycisphaerales bacterium]
MSAQTGTISFACPQCGRPFSVPSIYAGRKAACKSCGGKIVVPSPVDLAPTGDGPPTPQPGDTVRAVASGELSTEALREQILSDEAIPPAASARPLRPAPTPPVPETQTPPPYVAAASPVVPESDSSHFARVEEISPSPLDHEPAAVEIAPAVSEPPPERPAPTPQPHPVDSPATMPTTPRLPVRTRRLIADAGQMAGAFTDFRAIRIKSTVGDPPEVYQIEYKIAGLQRGRRANKPKKQNTHL